MRSSHECTPTALLVRLFGLGLDREWALAHHGPKFFRRLWGELLSLKLLGATTRDAHGWRLTEQGRYWLMLMMAEFFQSVNAYRDAMRAHAAAEQAAAETARVQPTGAGPVQAAT